jgi:hypothetical protein
MSLVMQVVPSASKVPRKQMLFAHTPDATQGPALQLVPATLFRHEMAAVVVATVVVDDNNVGNGEDILVVAIVAVVVLGAKVTVVVPGVVVEVMVVFIEVEVEEELLAETKTTEP